MTNFKHILSGGLLALALIGCGGAAKGGTGLAKGGDVPPPPTIPGATATAPDGTPVVVKREVSKDARKDYESAASAFAESDKSGRWNEGACRSSADRFASVAREHSLVEAQFMVGLSFHR